MSTDETYNGWANRETWAVALHINNDQGWQESVHEALRNDLDGDQFGFWDTVTDDVAAASRAGDIIRENVEEWADVESLPAGIMGGTDPDALADWAAIRNDIGSLWRVNWTELGRSFLEDLDQ